MDGFALQARETIARTNVEIDDFSHWNRKDNVDIE